MAGLCEGGNEPAGSLNAIGAHNKSGLSPPVISLWINTISDEENLDLFIAITNKVHNPLVTPQRAAFPMEGEGC
ncbi:hypothetical protein ANN_10626 [Periplaneta americana]|uniref:Uncharacterized protein n=1 Tax=Periplaneta americana TaxID=6978 RepID=A0ABQ8T4G0_PERAM|nr:hypothetical protein ANN_10626 [Periplaneta americana]